MRHDRCDWLTVSLHGVADTPSACDVLLSNFKQFGLELDRCQPTRWYRESYFFRDGVTVHFGRRTKRLAPAMVELRGDFFEAFGPGAMEIALYFISVGKVCRIDWCWDFVSRHGDFEPSLQISDVRGKRKQKIEPKGFWVGDQFQDTGFVSGTSDFRLRYYDKKEESSCQDWEVLEWWRFEVVCRGNLVKAQKWAGPDGRITSESVSKVVQGCLLRRFEVEKITFEGECVPVPRARDLAFDQKLEKARNRALRARRDHLVLLAQRGNFNGVQRNGHFTDSASWGQVFYRSGRDGGPVVGVDPRKPDS